MPVREAPFSGAPEVIPGAGGIGVETDENARLAEIMEVLVAIASKDFTRRATVGDGSHLLDGIAAGLNMLAEEASKQNKLDHEYRRRIAHAERLAAVGQLAASVAHEINNPAAFVLTNLAALEDRLASVESFVGEMRGGFPRGGFPDRRVAELLARTGTDAALDDARRILQDSVSGVQRVVAIVKDLRGFSRVEDGRAEEVSLSDVCEDACKLVSHEIVYRARFVKNIEPTPRILANRIQLTQVLTNLLLNAAQAVVEGDRENNRVELHTGVLGDRVFVRVRDTGVGIPAEVRPRLFEPFFTTKPGDRGTGLGLAVSSEIVRKHRGELRFESTPGEGTSFEIWLPIDTGLPRRSLPPESLQAPSPRLKVLIIDDEEELLVAYQRLFGKHYDLSLARGGREAVTLLERDARWDAILCDIMMPDLDGTAVYDWIQEHRPSLLQRLGFCTGGVFTPRSRDLADRVAGQLFEKPLSRAQVMAAVEALRHGALERHRPAPPA